MGACRRSAFASLALLLVFLPLAGLAQYPLVVGAPKSVFSRPDASPGILRERAVALNLPAAPQAFAKSAATLDIAFFDDAVFRVILKTREPTQSGGIAYTGEVAGIPHSTVVIVDNAGTVSVRLHVPGGRFSIRGSAETGYVAREHVDVDRPPHGPDYERQPPPGVHEVPQHLLKSVPAERAAPAALMADPGSSIDVMVVYTQAARAANGGAAQVHAEIDADIALTNTFYANSNVVQRLRLVYKGEVVHTEASSAVDLGRLASTNDGFLDEVPVLRDLYRADLVSLWGVYPDTCGRGYLMANETSDFAPLGFNIVNSPDCTGPGTHTLAHELGHNMGLDHEGAVPGTVATTTVTPEAGGPAVNITYAHGYVDLVNRFRTVMAYGVQCAAQIPAINCAFIPHFSNPAITFDNRPFYGGASAFAPTGNAAASNEAQVLNDTRETTANFRQPALASFTGPGSILFMPTSYSIAEGGGSIVLKVSRHLGSTGAVSVSYATANGTATAGSDYTATSGTLNWASGDAAEKTITVPILQDAVLEGHETFTVTLGAPTGGAAIVAGGGTATVRILDDEPDTFPAGSALPAGYTSPNAPNPNMPNSQWTVDLTQGRLSTASLQSAKVRAPDGTFASFGNSDLEYTATLNAGNVTFYYRLSSYHGGLAGFEFQVDGVAVFSNTAGGEVDWTLVTVPVTAGAHTLRWRFKNKLAFPCAEAIPAPPGGGACADRAWIDSVTFPSIPFTLGVALAGTGGGSVAGAGISCPPDCSESVNPGTVIGLAATPGTGSAFTGWSGGGCSGTGGCNVTVDANKVVTATFTLNRYTVTTAAGAHGYIDPLPGTSQVDHGDRVSFKVFPDPGYAYSVGGTCPKGSIFRDEYTSGRIGASCNVVVSFALAPVTLTVAKSGSGSGTVSGTGIACGIDCSEAVNPGTVVSLTASADVGSTFAGWSGGGCSGTAGCSVTVDVAKTVTASFMLKQYVVSASAGANGSISPASQQVGHGSTATVTVTPNTAYAASVGGTCPAGTLAGTTYTTGPVIGACSVTATFNPVPPANPPRLGNISTRMQVLTGDDVMIAGFIIGGSAPKTVVVRARGPSLAAQGVPGVLANPQLQLFSGPTQIGVNDDWGAAANAASLISSGFAPSDSKESAILVTLAPGAYTAIVSGVAGGMGVAIVEVFEVDAIETPLINIATRGKVLTGDNVMIAGIIIQGDGPQTVVVRARGPSLAAQGVPGVLANPQLQLFSGPTPIASNNDWQDTDAAAIQASGFAPSNLLESAILVTLQPGAYTAIVTGAAGGTGVAIVEVFTK